MPKKKEKEKKKMEATFRLPESKPNERRIVYKERERARELLADLVAWKRRVKDSNNIPCLPTV